MMSESEILGLISSKNGVSYREKSEQLEQAWEKTIANKECNSEEGISLLNEMDTEKDWTIESCKRYALKAVKLKDVFDVIVVLKKLSGIMGNKFPVGDKFVRILLFGETKLSREWETFLEENMEKVKHLLDYQNGLG